MVLRQLYVDQVKTVAAVRRLKVSILSPKGVNKLPSSFVIVEIEHPGNPPKSVMGLFEYSYGGLRLVAIDDEELASKEGDEIIHFFHGPLQRISTAKVTLIEPQS